MAKAPGPARPPVAPRDRRARSAHSQAAPPTPATAEHGPRLDLADGLTIAVLVFAPLVAGRFDDIPAHALSGVLCLAALLALAASRRGPGLLPPLVPLAGVLLLGLSATLSVVASVARGPSLIALSHWLGWLLLFAMMLRLGRTATGRRAALGALALAAGVVGALALAEYLRVSRDLPGGSIWRTFGPFAGPNILASFLAMTLPPLLAASLAAERRGVALALGAVVLLELAALPLTGSRGGLLALAGGLIALAAVAALRREWPDRRALARLAAIAAFGLPLLFLLSGPIAGRLAASRQPATAPAAPAGANEQARSNQFRRLTWQSTARMATAHPILGTGVGTFKYAHPRYAIAGFTEMAHQSYLQIAAEMGALALTGLLIALGGAARAALRAPRVPGIERWLAAGLAGGIAASAAHNLIDYSWYVYGTAALFWGMMGLLVSLPTPPAPLPMGEGGERLSIRPLAITLLLLLLAGNLLLESAAARKASGEAAREERRVREAIDAYTAAARLFPLDPAPRQALGDLYLATGDTGRAIEQYRAATRLAPTRSVHFYRLGRALARAGHPEEAMAAFRQGLMWDPNSIELLTEIAALQRASGDREEALATYRRVIAIWEGPVGQVTAITGMKDYRPAIALTALAEAAEAAGRSEEACRHYERAATLLRDRRTGMAWMRNILQEMERWRPEDEAERRREEARLWERVADCAGAAGRRERATEARRFADEARAEASSR